MRLRRKIGNDPFLIGQEPNKRRKLVPPHIQISNAKNLELQHRQGVLPRESMPKVIMFLNIVRIQMHVLET